uniref:Uncharacterized protein n=1 Tax=Romanomermis culicivorax TaxID=13658 RepID=A0A915KHA3_ROMCU
MVQSYSILTLVVGLRVCRRVFASGRRRGKDLFPSKRNSEQFLLNTKMVEGNKKSYTKDWSFHLIQSANSQCVRQKFLLFSSFSTLRFSPSIKISNSAAEILRFTARFRTDATLDRGSLKVEGVDQLDYLIVGPTSDIDAVDLSQKCLVDSKINGPSCEQSDISILCQWEVMMKKHYLEQKKSPGKRPALAAIPSSSIFSKNCNDGTLSLATKCVPVSISKKEKLNHCDHYALKFSTSFTFGAT